MLLSNASQIREADRIQISENGTPGVILMEHAGRAATDEILKRYPGQEKFLVLAGPGNNGGDGLVIARLLHLAGKKVRVLLSHPPDRFLGDALINYQSLRALPVPVAIFSEEKAREGLAFLPIGLPAPQHAVPPAAKASDSPILIDALLGTGISGPLRDPIKAIIAFFRPMQLTTVAIDLPSGLGADSGQVFTEPLLADCTLTFHLPKICHAVTPASLRCGEVKVLEIGMWPGVNARLGIKRLWTDIDWGKEMRKRRQKEGHKGSYGHVLIVGGSRPMAGAVALAAKAAVSGGAGLVTVFCPAACRAAVNFHAPEAMCFTAAGDVIGEEDIPVFRAALHKKDIVVLGPGLGKHPDTEIFLKKALPFISCPLVIDADGLNILAMHESCWHDLPEHTTLTPHPGEMERLTGRSDVQTQRLELAEALAQEKGCTVVLKGAGTITALPNGKSFVNRSGNPGLGSGGTGDVLAGLIGALLAQGYADIAAAYAVWLHGFAADRLVEHHGQEGIRAGKLADHLWFE
ncbi:MAG: NAD(P)H-hydrate dehydratase [Bacteroidia bacterium]